MGDVYVPPHYLCSVLVLCKAIAVALGSVSVGMWAQPGWLGYFRRDRE